MRFVNLTNEYFHNWCREIFGDFAIPEVKETNIHYGGVDFESTNIIFINGDEDPWRHASVNYSKQIAGNWYLYANCTDCAHCVDLGMPKESDPKELTQVRL